VDQVILNMLDQYKCVTDDDYENALKQIMQQIALLGLWRAKFFEHAAFYGGTALRILYQLDRFSEDLDFSLLNSNSSFDLNNYLHAIQTELTSFGFTCRIALKEKNIETDIQSAFLKANTQQHLIEIDAPDAVKKRCHAQKELRIKLEVDTDPPLGFETETKPLLNPIPFWIKSYTLPDLFAGKISASLCRQWQTRIKGRDWYDFLWFIQRKTPVHLSHLEKRLRAQGFYTKNMPLDVVTVKTMLANKIETLDISLAKEDISKFISDSSRLDGWSRELFLACVDGLSFT
jgi:predicted nucleotidyltransferase component of viral defense system